MQKQNNALSFPILLIMRKKQTTTSKTTARAVAISFAIEGVNHASFSFSRCRRYSFRRRK